jgi:AcrR family transcriptional regulator
MFLRGATATTVDDVLAAAGVGASQFYHYFGNKQGLIRAVIARQADSTMEWQRPIIDQLDSFEALEEWRDLLVVTQQRRRCQGGCAIGSLASQLAESQPEVRPDLASAFRRWEDPLRRGLQTMLDRGDLRPSANPETLALALLAALEGGMLLAQTHRETTPLEAALDSMINYIRTFRNTTPTPS